MTRTRSRVSRRGALGALATTLVTVGCGSSRQGSAGAAGAGGASGGAGAGGASGGAAAGGASGGGTGGASGGAGTGGSAAAGGNAGSGGSAGSASCKLPPTPGCKITDDNILGPFYRPDAPFRTDLRDGVPGTVLLVQGTVYGCDCVTPLVGAIVDVWQANDGGAYDNAGYVLRGRVETNAEGHYAFETILPGFYLNGSTYRPRHIHYKVSHSDGIALTTQLYFEGDPYIPVDPFVKPSLIMPVVEETAPDGSKQLRVTFDVVLG